MSTEAINRTITNKDGVEIVVGPEKGSNNVPLADWGTTFRPTPESVTDFLGADAQNGTTPQAAASQDVLPAQGYVPPSNHFGEDLTLEDRDLSDLRTQLVIQANSTTPTTAGAVSVPIEDMDYVPEDVAGDVIPDRDQPDDSQPPEGAGPPEEPPAEPETDPTSDLPPLPTE
jgi:hypothetical protein